MNCRYNVAPTEKLDGEILGKDGLLCFDAILAT